MAANTVATVDQLNNIIPLTVEDDNTVIIEDEDTPLTNQQLDNGKLWWSWIPVVGAAVSGYEGIKRNKEEDIPEETE